MGLAPSALAHDGSHDISEAARLGGGAVAFIVTAIVLKRIPVTANLPSAATAAVRIGTGVKGGGEAIGFYQKYASHVVNMVVKGQEAMIRANSNPNAPNLLYGAHP